MKLPGIINQRIEAARVFFKTHYFLAGLLIAGIALLGIGEVQKYLDRRAVERQVKTVEQLETEKKVSQEQTQKLLDLFARQHEQTVSILDAIKEMNGSISELIENDRRQDDAVKNLRQEYQNAKQPNEKNQQNNSVRRVRANRPVSEREADVLATDRQLYPGN